ncbi:hypothetical protein POSPLADRAFT_1041173 [Postia placenta MAD-698-R-SB12]|uniref:Uncharacterized protein n=1 Tax=Postia placenta MAD-698-R-SB12 TaxID=670580 RepID=A0A1X6MR48_9APHY|nr:hypothetical protein POSPLADRAFT_1041173 [Postia placenta MAD-698-R-SB12]OSX58871.1 hypothetical protein POSPLADRAFT_1041173 [Postia placenta MAD-698-R-SB12]
MFHEEPDQEGAGAQPCWCLVEDRIEIAPLVLSQVGICVDFWTDMQQTMLPGPHIACHDARTSHFHLRPSGDPLICSLLYLSIVGHNGHGLMHRRCHNCARTSILFRLSTEYLTISVGAVCLWRDRVNAVEYGRPTCALHFLPERNLSCHTSYTQ